MKVLLRDYGAPMAAPRLAELIEPPDYWSETKLRKNVGVLLAQYAKRGTFRRVSRGRYTLSSPNDQALRRPGNAAPSA